MSVVGLHVEGLLINSIAFSLETSRRFHLQNTVSPVNINADLCTSPSPSLSLSSLPFVRPFSRPSRTIHPFGVEGNEGEATRSFLECVTFRDEWMEIFFFFSKRRSNEDRVRISSRRPPERERERGIFFLFLKRAERSAATLTASVVITLATLPEVTSTG